jgi:hypothetical protein
MKNLLFTLALLISFNSFGQSNAILQSEFIEKELKKDFDLYTLHMNNRDFESAMDFIIPEIFSLMTKEQMIKTFEDAFAGGLEMEILNYNDISISEVVKFEGKDYCKVQSSSDIYMKISGNYLTNIETIKTNFDLSFGKRSDSFVYNESDNTFYGKGFIENRIAVSVSGTNDWKFIAIDNFDETVLAMIIPEQVLNKL